MEFSEIFGFFIILNESIKLIPKNLKLLASIVTVSILLPSSLFLLFTKIWQSWKDYMYASSIEPTATNILKYLAPLLAVEIAFLLVYLIISHLSGIATILVSAAAYTGDKLSLQDLYSKIKKTWRRPLKTRFRASGQSIRYFAFFVILATLILIRYPNPVTISTAVILWIILLVFQLYSSVSWAVSIVVSVIEDGCQGKEAMDKAEQLVEGQRLHGFMLNLFVNLLVLVICFVCWIVLGDKGSLNLTIYGLLFLNFGSVLRIFVLLAYTVFYVRCKRHHGEVMEKIGDLQYKKLPTTVPGCDIP